MLRVWLMFGGLPYWKRLREYISNTVVDLDGHVAASGSGVTVDSSEPRCGRWRHKIGWEKRADCQEYMYDWGFI